jgi:16S rRNA processing protein RimM
LEKPIVVGKILTTHGVHGQMKVQSMMQIPGMLEHIAPFSINGATFSQWSYFKSMGKPGLFLGRLPEIITMDQASVLRHSHILVHRSQLPELEGETYYADLEKKPVVDCHGVPMGHVVWVHDFGAGPVLELDPSGVMISFYAIEDADADVLQLKMPKHTFS